jgi:hypothetical protein
MISRGGGEEERSIHGVWGSVETECDRLGDDKLSSGADHRKGLKQKTKRS